MSFVLVNMFLARRIEPMKNQPTYIQYKRQEIKGLVIERYNNLYDLKRNPVLAVLLGDKGTISKVTKQKYGVVYIPWAELALHKKIKIIRGRKGNYKYEIWRKIRVEEYMVNYEMKKYNRAGEIKQLEGVAV